MKLRLDGRPALDLGGFEPPLTEAQQRAMALGELVVSAGAGAGKTQTLSLRYVSLLLELAIEALERGGERRVDVERVLVLTFTEKAAGELADRCYRRLLELGLEARARGEDIATAFGARYARDLIVQLDHLIDTFDSARISTFHGFCARLLREFPAETGTPAGFEILEPMEASRIRADIVERTLSRFTRERPAVVRELLDAFGSRRWLLEALDQATRERAALAPTLARCAGPLTLDDLIRDLSPSPDQARRWLTDEALPALAEIGALTAQAGGPWVQQSLIPLVERLAALPDDPVEIYTLYGSALACVTTGEPPKLRSLAHHTVMGKKGDWPSAGAYSDAKLALAALQASLGAWPALARAARGLPNACDRVLPHYLQRFAELATAACRDLRDRTDQLGVIDFTDLQARAVDAVLRDAGLRALLQQRFRYLMVDEFQDTDEAQWRLVHALGRPGGEPSDRVFLVGDVKQAIYSFRGGDVTVFRRAAAQLGVAPLVLPDNFRSRTELIDWFNDFFAGTLGPAEAARPEWEAHYEALEPGRGLGGGSVTLLTHSQPPGVPTNQIESQAIARLIAAEVLAGAPPYQGLNLDDRQRYPTPPVAILLRARTHMQLYEGALREAGVPAVVARGVGFWERPEVVDLSNLLHALATGDPISTAGALRSPLLCVDDQSLHDLLTGQLGVTSPGGFGRQPLSDAARPVPPVLADADRHYRALLALKDRVPPSELLRRVLDMAAAWHAYALRDPDGQAEANALRLIGIVARLERRTGGGLDGVARHLLHQVEQRARESEAALQPGEARVVLMTVHASKGLEFPVVFVPDLAFATTGRPEPLTLRQLGGEWAMAFQVPEPGAPIRRRAQPGRMKRLEQRRRREELAEHKRLLYVATTRARDHLVLLGRGSARLAPEPRTWMQLIEAHHGHPLQSDARLTVRPIEQALALALPPRAPPPPPPPPPIDAGRAVGPVVTQGTLEVADTELDLFAGCPARWYRRALLGIPEPGITPAAAPVDHPALAALAEAPGRIGVRYRRDWGGVVVRGLVDRLWYDEAGERWALLSLGAPGVEPGPLQLLARCRAAAEVLVTHEQPPPSRARLLHSDGGETTLTDPEHQLPILDSVLGALRAVAGTPWSTVEQTVTQGAAPRPCGRCGYAGRGCAGQPPAETARGSGG